MPFRRESGFTLIEVMAVLTILAIIAIIAVPTIGNLFDTAESGADQATVDMIEDAARMAHVDNIDSEVFYVKDLVDDGYLDYDYTAPGAFNGKAIHTGSWTYTYLNDNILTNGARLEHRVGDNSLGLAGSKLEPGTYTLSFNYETTVEAERITSFLIYGENAVARAPITEDGSRTSVTFNISGNNANRLLGIYYGQNSQTSRANAGVFTNMKLEKGQVATPYVEGY